MEVFILVVYLFTGNAFYGKDAVPTIEFTSEQKCKEFASKLKERKEVKTEFLCFKK